MKGFETGAVRDGANDSGARAGRDGACRNICVLGHSGRPVSYPWFGQARVKNKMTILVIYIAQPRLKSNFLDGF